MSTQEASAALSAKETGCSDSVSTGGTVSPVHSTWPEITGLFTGVGPAYDRVGTRDSIMIRVPDHTVTGHLCDITGPLAITSANPSGEPDSTHHDMVIR